MEKSGRICFIRHPRTIGDLMQPHLHKHEREYQIVKTIELGKMDYGQEDYVFGSSTADARHWDKYVLKVFQEHAETLASLFNK